MGAVQSWLAQCVYPEEQVFWQYARQGDVNNLRRKLTEATLENRRHIEWKEPISGRSAIAEAAYHGHLPCVVALKETGAELSTKDYNGNTPLHHAATQGYADIVNYLLLIPSVNAFEKNMKHRTALDAVRRKLAKMDENDTRFIRHRLEACIAAIETKFCIYSGWLYVKKDNLFSLVSGVTALNSWRRRYCIVLSSVPGTLEFSLFEMSTSGRRPAIPDTVITYNISAGVLDIEDSKWFNKKEYTFSIYGAVLNPSKHHDQNGTSRPMQVVEFAAFDQAGYDAWKSFFTWQQQVNSQYSNQLNTEPNQATNFHEPLQHIYPSIGAAIPNTPDSIPPASSSTDENFAPKHAHILSTKSNHQDLIADEEEQTNIAKAIELSLRESRLQANNANLEVSAPMWEEETFEQSSSLNNRPNRSSAGECVICYDAPQNAVCVPCGHNAICMSCAEGLKNTTRLCPVCREHTREFIKLYRV